VGVGGSVSVIVAARASMAVPNPCPSAAGTMAAGARAATGARAAVYPCAPRVQIEGAAGGVRE
jgi:hypothetical protein